MTYELPEPAYKASEREKEGEDVYTAEQVQAAYAAGREAMREEAANLMDAFIGNATYSDAIRGIK